MNWKHRAVRLTAALTLALIIGAQIPSNSGVALAQRDDYPEEAESGGGEAIRIAAAGATVLGLASVISGGTNPGAAVGGLSGITPGVGTGPATLVPGVAQSQPIWDVSNTTNDLNQYAKIAEAAGYKEELRQEGQFTAFIPNNGAFDRLGTAAIGDLTNPANQARLSDLVASHVIIGKKTIDDLKREATAAGADGVQYDTLSGRKLRVTVDAQQTLRVNGVIVRENNIPASNGIIHPIQDVIDVDAANTATPPPTAPEAAPGTP